MAALNDNEGTFLALVLRLQPTTAYQVAKVYELSPVTNYKTHKGKIYPIIERLVARGWLEKRPVEGDRRGTEQLLCTEDGREAVRQWVMQIPPAHMLLDDPLRTKVQSFEILSDEERVRWVLDAKAKLHLKLAELETYQLEVDVPFKQFVHDHAVRSIRMRMDWLDSLIAGLASVSGPSGDPFRVYGDGTPGR